MTAVAPESAASRERLNDPCRETCPLIQVRRKFYERPEADLRDLQFSMTIIQKSSDCGNSPKNRLLQELTIAMARGDTQRVRELVSDDVHWLAIGRQPVHGVDAFCKWISRYGAASRLTIEHVVSHGRSGAVNGVVSFGEKSRAFCHMYEFASAKGTSVKSLTSYTIALK
jgi:hypothetical protein